MLNYTKIERKDGNLIAWQIVHRDKKDELIGEIEFLLVSDEVWLNKIWISEDFQRQGLASKILIDSISEFGKIFVSKSEKGQHKRNNILDDSRYIDSDEGLQFINSIIERGILKREWHKDAF